MEKLLEIQKYFKTILSLQFLYVIGLETILKQEMYMIIILEEDTKTLLMLIGEDELKMSGIITKASSVLNENINFQ